MLRFVDQADVVRIVRIGAGADGKPVRTRVGALSKAHMVITPELRIAASEAELEEIEEVARHYAGLAELETQWLSAKLPAILRAVMQRYESGADPIERHLIAGAVSEAMRTIRRVDKAAHDAPLED